MFLEQSSSNMVVNRLESQLVQINSLCGQESQNMIHKIDKGCLCLRDINLLWPLFKIQSCVYMKGKFVTNVSFATVRLINHSWDRIKCLASCFIKNIFFLLSFTPVGCKYLSLPSQYLKRTFSDFFFNINHKTDMNINE